MNGAERRVPGSGNDSEREIKTDGIRTLRKTDAERVKLIGCAARTVRHQQGHHILQKIELLVVVLEQDPRHHHRVREMMDSRVCVIANGLELLGCQRVKADSSEDTHKYRQRSGDKPIA
jgi:hypothetical protein